MRGKLQISVICVLASSISLYASDLKPLNSEGFYEKDGEKFELGLYPNGTNEIPEAHRKHGERISKSIVPLNKNGEKDIENGKIVALVVGHSNPRSYFAHFSKFIGIKIDERIINPKFEIRNDSSGGMLVGDWIKRLRKGAKNLAKKRSSLRQVQIVFVLMTYHRATRARTIQANPGLLEMPFRKKILEMRDDLKTVMGLLMKMCPNLKIALVGSDTWRGYGDLEPEVFEEGFAYKWLIEDQLNGDKNLTFEGQDRKSPWIDWGGYIWEPNSPRDRFTRRDGVHPSAKGRDFVTETWYRSMLRNPVCMPWFVR
jgi:hypothetical protein